MQGLRAKGTLPRLSAQRSKVGKPTQEGTSHQRRLAKFLGRLLELARRHDHQRDASCLEGKLRRDLPKGRPLAATSPHFLADRGGATPGCSLVCAS